jgi:type II secretory pathway pseudopilin PulG
MKCSFNKSDAWFVFHRELRDARSAIRNRREKAFSLAETAAALIILAFISSSVLVVINRYMASAVDSVIRMQAFEVARKNMEELLTSDTVSESADYGDSEIYPDIHWETTVESFSEPLTSKMWIQAICTAEYTDSEGELRTVKLTHWLTDLTKAQTLQILARQEEESSIQIIETMEEAIEYTGADEETIQQWIDNGMPLTEDGKFTKDQLDLYKNTGGDPTNIDIDQEMLSFPDLSDPNNR